MAFRSPLEGKHPVIIGLLWVVLAVAFTGGFAWLQGFPVALMFADQSALQLVGVVGFLAAIGVAFGFTMKFYKDRVVPRIPRGPLGWAIMLPPSLLILYLLFR